MKTPPSFLLVLILTLSFASPTFASGYRELLALYNDFRELAQDPVRDGVGDYGAEAMAERHAALASLLRDMEALDDSAWPTSERVDYLLTLAEMRALDFHHRTLRPWERDPSFYSTLVLGFGPRIVDAIPLPEFPIEEADALAKFSEDLRQVPEVLRRARANLTDLRGDLARLGIEQKKIERNLYARYVEELGEQHPDLVPAAEAALVATEGFLSWLEVQKNNVPQRAGIGKEAFDWYLRHVLLLPYTWGEMRVLGEREYRRSMAFLKIEENEHRGLSMPEPVTSLAGFEALRSEADAELLAFLESGNILTVPDYLVPPKGEGPYLMPVDRDPERTDPFAPPIRRNFFRETEDRDPRPLRAHNVPGHLLDQLIMARDTRPIRGDDRLYFIDSSRIEGWAFYLEEMLLQAGFLDARPKAREIHYILQIKRAARIAPELLMHSNDWSFEEALASLTGRTPYWMEADDDTAIYDLGLYLRQPGLGINYYFGKLQLEALLAERAEQLGAEFDLKTFHDRFLAAGAIPISLIRWEMTGRDDEVRQMR
ncbi:MAG: DUF885 family protein [Halieaceae bacterium]|jgi:hypothetical protein|nr:DUF885 family protein [Halieaceae bacterium]